AGVDEVGRGSLAGDVVAAAVVLDVKKPIAGLADSKKLTKNQRERVYREIQERAICYSVGRASPVEIDSLNILQASLLAMARSVQSLRTEPKFIYVDGIHLPDWGYLSEAIVRGDSLVPSIAAASIIAKVTRDKEMVAMDRLYPEYGFAKNKGYPTKLHIKALDSLGPCFIHRNSFRPVSALRR
ncbi:MAG: ribonuclease HII, partial [Gammaproteobacteria bacterium]|nr:ribonuclease HII [Gammaproteobacteria bacterium]